MIEKKTSKAQIKASHAWKEWNRKKSNLDSYKRTARLFVRKADENYIDNLIELQQQIQEKLKELINLEEFESLMEQRKNDLNK